MKDRNDSSEKKVERMLEELPALKDQRSKDEVYQKIKNRMDPNHLGDRRPKWMVPVVSAAAALILLLLLIPTSAPFTNQSSSPEDAVDIEERQSSQEGVERESQAENDEQEESMNTFESSEQETERNKTEQEDNLDNERIEQEPPVETNEGSPAFENYVAAVNAEDIGEGETSITVPLQDRESSIVIPLTFVVEASQEPIELFEESIREYTGESFGLTSSPLQDIDWESHETDQAPIAAFEKDMSSISSTESEMIIRSIEESLRFLGENEVVFSQDGETGVELGKYGFLENYSLEQDNRGYYVYTTDENMSFLVSGKAANVTNVDEKGELLSLQETLENMKKDIEDRHVAASIPNEVAIDAVQEEGEMARIVFSEDSKFPDENHTRVMIEAVLFAASDFGYNQVSFDGEGVGSAAEYNLDDPIEVPVAPNYVRR